MSKWLASGTRRDICILLYGEEMPAQKLKSALQDRYDRRIDPEQFRAALRALEDTGHVEKRVDGLADVFSLSEAGRRGVERQYEWFEQRVGGE
ncbi:PadR family transcriptional regulator [Halorarius halobius]|uniref:PadR family transcriptional regulator n=1 Tax=Halorarius halobius TaxID=2962671 RepID=UPI0020CF2435|nr:PadR family transcriptional regulator [Halorarius halobius]